MNITNAEVYLRNGSIKVLVKEQLNNFEFSQEYL